MPYSNSLLRKKTQLFLGSLVLLFHLGATESISKKAQNFDKKILNFDEVCVCLSFLKPKKRIN